MSDRRVTEIKDDRIATHRFSKGIGLIETALFVGVIGLMLQAAMQVYHLNNINGKTQATNVALVTAREALNTYYFKNKRLPCPASRTVAQDTAAYGTSIKISHTRRPDVDVTNPADPEDYVYDCSVDAGVAVATAADGRGVQIGALPVKELGLQAGADLDSFGHRLVYAVTADYTTSDAKDVVEGMALATDMGEGAIAIHDSQGNPATSTDGNVVFTVIAPGKDGRGAYNSSGKLVKACDTTAGVLAGENCDDDATFASTTFRNEAMGAQAFSNKLVYKAGKKAGPDDPLPENPACKGGNMIGDVTFIVDTSDVSTNLMPLARGDHPSVERLDAKRMALGEVIPILYESKKDDPQPGMVGMMDMVSCASGTVAANKQCIFGDNGGFTPGQIASGSIDGTALDSALPTIMSKVNILDENTTKRPIFDRIVKAADAMGEGTPGNYNTIVVLNDGGNRGTSDVVSGRRGMIKYIAEKYPNLTVVFISTTRTWNADYLKPIKKAKKIYQMKGYEVWSRNVKDYKIAIKDATVCY